MPLGMYNIMRQHVLQIQRKVSQLYKANTTRLNSKAAFNCFAFDTKRPEVKCGLCLK